MVVEINLAFKALPYLAAGFKSMQVNAFVFQGRQSRSIMMLSIQRPLPSLEIRMLGFWWRAEINSELEQITVVHIPIKRNISRIRRHYGHFHHRRSD